MIIETSKPSKPGLLVSMIGVNLFFISKCVLSITFTFMLNLFSIQTERITRLLMGSMFYMLLALTVILISPFIFAVMIIDTKNSINQVMTNFKLLHRKEGFPELTNT